MKKSTYCAFLPYYDEVGTNATYYILEDGSRGVHPFPIKHFITDKLHTLWLDPLMLRRLSQQILQMRTHVPIILNADQLFIPIKIRTNVPMHDGCLGYVLTSAIAHYDNYTITLYNGAIIKTLSSAPYIAKKLREAELLNYRYKELILQHISPKSYV